MAPPFKYFTTELTETVLRRIMGGDCLIKIISAVSVISVVNYKKGPDPYLKAYEIGFT